MLQPFELTPTPFARSNERPKVFVATGRSGYDNTVEALSNIDLSPAAGKKVLLKPNVGRMAEPNSGICTSPEVVAAAIDVFRGVGADVAIGESPISGVKTMEAFESTGIAETARKRGCPLIDMDSRKPLVISLPDGIAIKSLKLCADVADFDVIVSIPVMKTHMHTVVTLSVKNMKGCLWRRSKVTLHMLPEIDGMEEKPLDVAISDLSKALKPHLSIIDGIVGLEGMGPSAGAKKELGAVVVGADSFAADAVACALMGLSAEDVPHLRMGAERGYGVIDLGGIDVEPCDWRKAVKAFAAPPARISVEYPGINVLDVNSCSACQSTLLLFLKRYRQELLAYFPGDANIAIGAGHDDIPPGTLCIGNCIRKEFRDRGIFIPGCPPVGSEILTAVTGEPSVDVKDGHGEGEAGGSGSKKNG